MGLLGGLLVLFLLAAPMAGAEPVEITIETYGLGDLRQGHIEAAIREFEQLNPDIKVNVVWDLADGYWERLLSRFVAGDTDLDVVINQVDWVAIGAESGMFADLRPHMERSGFDRSLHWPGCIEQWEVMNGTYAIAWQCGGEMMAYNVDHFSAAGLSAPGEDFDWRDLIDAGKRLTQTGADGEVTRYGVGFSGWQGYGAIPMWFSAFGGRIFDEAGETVVVNSSENADALRYLSSLSNEHNIAEVWGWDRFTVGNTSTLFSGDFIMGRLEEADVNWKAGYLPKGPAGRFVPRLGNSYSVWGNSPHLEEAWRLLEFLVTDGAYHFAKFTIPSYQPAVVDALQTQLGHRDVHVLLEQGARHSINPMPSTPDVGDIWRALSQETSASFRGEISPEEALERMEHRLNVILSERE